MNFPKPTRKGYMLDLWNRLEPNRAYSTDEINQIAEGLPVDTATNLIYTSVNKERGYLILDQSTGFYFRSDSNISMNSIQGLTREEAEIDEVEIARNINAIRKQLTEAKKQRSLKIEQLEQITQEVAELDQTIAAINEQLQPLRHFFPASAA